ncbi:hypothetical protein BDV24DRAFT_95029 [Aspergillus arachidicola]|uniref:Uncharacterized protein n=1 Tax=Aspergillus arachidicola TaxID=656916 RepID=A0A5N6XXB8_9EURO|nr:hypothetical protein BDV24DRAFT_95029 [Aspergillus arachidicola]
MKSLLTSSLDFSAAGCILLTICEGPEWRLEIDLNTECRWRLGELYARRCPAWKYFNVGGTLESVSD